MAFGMPSERNLGELRAFPSIYRAPSLRQASRASESSVVECCWRVLSAVKGSPPVSSKRLGCRDHPPGCRLSALRARGRRSQPVDPGRPGGRPHGGAQAAARSDRVPRAGRGTPARRRHPGAGSGPGARPTRAGPGSMSATMCRSAVRTRRRRCSATRGTARAIARSSIFAASPGSFRPTPMPDTGSSMSRAGRRLRPRRRPLRGATWPLKLQPSPSAHDRQAAFLAGRLLHVCAAHRAFSAVGGLSSA